MIHPSANELRNIVLNTNSKNFTETAISVFNFQYVNNEIYSAYCKLINVNPIEIDCIEKIPFLPIQFFKTHSIKTGVFYTDIIFESSGTSGAVNSKHFVKDITLYEESFLNTFRQFYGKETACCIIGLLPAYLERKGSSLVYMVDDLIKKSNNEDSGFYLYDHEKLKNVLLKNEANKQRTILIGVTYALLDFAEKYSLNLEHTIVMETGGMKGRREELNRKEVHRILRQHLQVASIHSEYGMTELLSQAYSQENGIFKCPAWMRILIRSEDDPFNLTANFDKALKYVAGGVNIIDLANIFSCSFIATDDAGKLYADESFEITGRLENSDIRGCSLMIID